MSIFSKIFGLAKEEKKQCERDQKCDCESRGGYSNEDQISMRDRAKSQFLGYLSEEGKAAFSIKEEDHDTAASYHTFEASASWEQGGFKNAIKFEFGVGDNFGLRANATFDQNNGVVKKRRLVVFGRYPEDSEKEFRLTLAVQYVVSAVMNHEAVRDGWFLRDPMEGGGVNKEFFAGSVKETVYTNKEFPVSIENRSRFGASHIVEIDTNKDWGVGPSMDFLVHQEENGLFQTFVIKDSEQYAKEFLERVRGNHIVPVALPGYGEDITDSIVPDAPIFALPKHKYVRPKRAWANWDNHRTEDSFNLPGRLFRESHKKDGFVPDELAETTFFVSVEDLKKDSVQYQLLMAKYWFMDDDWTGKWVFHQATYRKTLAETFWNSIDNRTNRFLQNRIHDTDRMECLSPEATVKSYTTHIGKSAVLLAREEWKEYVHVVESDIGTFVLLYDKYGFVEKWSLNQNCDIREAIALSARTRFLPEFLIA